MSEEEQKPSQPPTVMPPAAASAQARVLGKRSYRLLKLVPNQSPD